MNLFLKQRAIAGLREKRLAHPLVAGSPMWRALQGAADRGEVPQARLENPGQVPQAVGQPYWQPVIAELHDELEQVDALAGPAHGPLHEHFREWRKAKKAQLQHKHAQLVRHQTRMAVGRIVALLTATAGLIWLTSTIEKLRDEHKAAGALRAEAVQETDVARTGGRTTP